ncbi:MAG TPA: SCE4755 family polysaccharide monooxygenase-like protein [Polyangiaceae bacterium]|nr:SCE4755 family polysaccharide monooxygenase-like protein [Polyangiaceae bacterium]
MAALAFSASPSAQAHITLMNPPSWVVEGNLGDPQKAGPCGDDGSANIQKTDKVTQFTAGQTITVMWKETVGHPGHFRIALTKPGEDRSVLVDPPVETENGDGKTGLSISAEYVADGTGNVLKDHLFPRDTVSGAEPNPFSQDITLPDEPCEKCTLQVIQFMSQHGPGYFYHHCADIEIVAKDKAGVGNSGAVGAAGSASMGTGGSSSTGAGGSGAAINAAGSSSMSGDDGDDEDAGCSIAKGAPRSTGSGVALALLGLAATLRRRRSAR